MMRWVCPNCWYLLLWPGLLDFGVRGFSGTSAPCSLPCLLPGLLLLLFVLSLLLSHCQFHRLAHDHPAAVVDAAVDAAQPAHARERQARSTMAHLA